jgi:hypothetical protein
MLFKPESNGQTPRFNVNGDTVTDRLSGLTWTRNASYSHVFINWKDAGHIIQTDEYQNGFWIQ